MNKDYEPDSQFLDKLEWQLSSEYRRADRLKSDPRKIAVPRGVAVVALTVGILMTGVAMIKAAEYIQDSWRKKIEIARAETDVMLKKAHLESTVEMVTDAESRYSNGLIREEEYMAIKLAVERAELDVKRSLLDLDEVAASGQNARNELYAPKVRGRDFVSERLKIELSEVELELGTLGRQYSRFKALAEQNMISGNELEPLEAEIKFREATLVKIKQRLDLRKRYISKEIRAEEVEIAARLTESERNLQQAQAEAHLLQQQVERFKTREAQGLISSRETRHLQYALDAAQAKLKLATLEVTVLKKVR